MKLRKIISHPYTLVVSFFLIVVSGQQAGEFYLLYLLIGMPGGAVYSILGTAGIAVILISHFRYKKNDQSMKECVINLVGAIMLVLSLFLFFYTDTEKFYLERYSQLSTVLTLFVFGILTTFFITLIR